MDVTPGDVSALGISGWCEVLLNCNKIKVAFLSGGKVTSAGGCIWHSATLSLFNQVIKAPLVFRHSITLKKLLIR